MVDCLNDWEVSRLLGYEINLRDELALKVLQGLELTFL